MISETEIIDQWTVIADCIAKPDESSQALELLTTSMFTEPGCRDVFKAMLGLQAAGLPTDINHLIEQLESDRTYTAALGIRIHQAACDARAPQPVAYYAQRVLEHHRKRCARDILLRHHANLQNGHRLDETMSELQDDLQTLQVNTVVARARRRSDLNSGYRPFPLHVLPNAVRGFIGTASSAIGCDNSFMAPPNFEVHGTANLHPWHRELAPRTYVAPRTYAGR